MKKLLLTLSALATLSVGATAQTRLALYEEFTGENCGPCAGTNPDFWTLCLAGTNPTKMLQISYMVDIPSAGPFYYQNQPQTDVRRAYYSCTSAPNGRLDGHVASPTSASPGHPGYFAQPELDAEAAIASPFNITVTNVWNATYDSVIATVNITCVTAYTGTAVFLRAALIQTVDWATPPGSNGETHFKDVVRKMYPDAAGTSVAATWAVGATQTIVLRGAVPSYVAKDQAPYIAVWIQNDGDKAIAQAAKATPLPPVPNDCAITAVTAPGLVCVADGPYSAAHSVTLKNAGSNAITSCTIYYQLDGAGAFLSFPWTGSLAVGGTTTVSLPSTALTVAGAFYHSFYDSVAGVNGGADQNLGNNTMGKAYFTESTNGLAMPYTTSYESADLGKFWPTDDNSNGKTWGAWTNTAGLGHSSAIAEKFDCYQFASGETEVLTLPEVVTSSPSAMDFWVAYARYDGTSNDKLELVYSSTCGSSWTSLWSAAGTALLPATTTTSPFTPTSAQYKMKSVDISSVPAGSILGFRATSNYGNNIWVDDITVRAGAVVGVKEVAETVNLSVYPNPAVNQATIEFTLANATEVTTTVVDQLGRIVSNVTNNMVAGKNTIDINTSAFAAGVYHVSVRTTEGVYTQALTVAK